MRSRWILSGPKSPIKMSMSILDLCVHCTRRVLAKLAQVRRFHRKDWYVLVDKGLVGLLVKCELDRNVIKVPSDGSLPIQLY